MDKTHPYKNCRTVLKIESVREYNKGTELRKETETRYYISNLDRNAKEFNGFVRGFKPDVIEGTKDAIGGSIGLKFLGKKNFTLDVNMGLNYAFKSSKELVYQEEITFQVRTGYRLSAN